METPVQTSSASALRAYAQVEEGELRDQALQARRIIIDIAASPTGCHLGGSMSVVDILVAANSYVAPYARGEVILSKGHAAAALYAVLQVRGVLGEGAAQTYGSAQSLLTGHPNHHVPGVRFPTGSLGHGLAYALGWAMANPDQPAVAIVGDGELQEGLIWETLQVASAHQVGNLVVVVDVNGGQNDGLVSDVSPMPNLDRRFSAFGCTVTTVDGHDPATILQTLQDRSLAAPEPHVLLAKTIKGRGVTELEGSAACHYVTATAEERARWLEGLE